MAKNPRVTENESAAGGRGVVDVGCSLFTRSLGSRYSYITFAQASAESRGDEWAGANLATWEASNSIHLRRER